MRCDECGRDCGALSFDIEYQAFLCPACRERMDAVIEAPKPKTCPFCHGPYVKASWIDDETAHVYCTSCQASGPESATMAGAIRAWNGARRTE